MSDGLGAELQNIQAAAAALWRFTCPDCGGEVRVSRVVPVFDEGAGKIEFLCQNRAEGKCKIGGGAFMLYWGRGVGFFKG